MRVLIDESLPVELADELVGHTPATVRDQQWTGLQNGVLLRAAADAGFDAIISADQSLGHQQNLRRIGIAAVVLVGVRNRIAEVRLLVPRILDALAVARPGDLILVHPQRGSHIRDRVALHV